MLLVTDPFKFVIVDCTVLDSPEMLLLTDLSRLLIDPSTELLNPKMLADSEELKVPIESATSLDNPKILVFNVPTESCKLVASPKIELVKLSLKLLTVVKKPFDNADVLFDMVPLMTLIVFAKSFETLFDRPLIWNEMDVFKELIVPNTLLNRPLTMLVIDVLSPTIETKTLLDKLPNPTKTLFERPSLLILKLVMLVESP
jgi:hypothetical protein